MIFCNKNITCFYIIKNWEADARGSSQDLPALFQRMRIFPEREFKTIFDLMLS